MEKQSRFDRKYTFVYTEPFKINSQKEEMNKQSFSFFDFCCVCYLRSQSVFDIIVLWTVPVSSDWLRRRKCSVR